MYLGLDLGTSSIKALLIDGEQNIVGQADASLTVLRPHPGWSEQSPDDWIVAAERAVDRLSENFSQQLSAVRSIGLSGQMHGATLLDKADAPLRNCILWNDVRSHLEATELDGDPDYRRISGNIVFPGFTAPKLLWVARNEAEIFDRVATVLLPKDYLRLWLTGELVSDMSDAAGTSWLDTGRRGWSTVLLDKSSMQDDQMPTLVEGSEPSGTLRLELAQRWGMGMSVIVAGGAGDNAAAAIGMGTIGEGDAFVSLGTSGVLFAANNHFRPKPESAVHTFCHAIPDTWHQMGVILSATDSLQWLASLTGKSPEELTSELGEEIDAPGRTMFLPYLSGERTPHNDATASGVFAGITHMSGRADMTRAVMEGVAFALRDNMEALGQAGTILKRAIAVGGGSRSSYWLSLIASVLGIQVDVPASGEYGAAFGAARLALMAGEGAEPSSVATPPKIARSHEPQAKLSAAFEEAYGRFHRLYPAVKGAMT